jgi:virginiamycin B lyase
MSKEWFLSLIAAATIGAAPPAGAQTPASHPDYPDGPGRDTFITVCNGCHDANRARAGYTPQAWRTVIRMMLNFHAPIPPDQVDTLTAYLIKSFPERPRPAAKLIDGPVKISIKLWDVTTPGSRPHDPMAAQDGSVWYSGQLANRLGRLDPKTGAIKEYPLAPMTGPHGLVEDKDGDIWFTGNFAGLVGKLNPKTGEVTAYQMPDPKARDPHTIALDQRGVVWFTLQQANMLGRIDPKTGSVKLVSSPTLKSRPYGLKISSSGIPIFVEFGANKIATVDPQTMAIKEHLLPDAKARPRRLALSDDNTVWYTDYARGYLGRLDLATGAVKEWPSPSGAKSAPYGIAFAKGAVWYNESFAKPNTIVRFDPRTERFQSWAIPGGGDIVRNMDVTPNGNPVTANSLVNQIGLIEEH